MTALFVLLLLGVCGGLFLVWVVCDYLIDVIVGDGRGESAERRVQLSAAAMGKEARS